jgi:hypothetical protein
MSFTDCTAVHVLMANAARAVICRHAIAIRELNSYPLIGPKTRSRSIEISGHPSASNAVLVSIASVI